MKCTNCGNELNPGQKFCTKCGTPAPAPEVKSAGLQCPSCGKALNPGQKFCTGCGTPVAQATPKVQAPQAAQCPSCGKALNPGQKFCTGCGTPVAQAAPVQPGEKGVFSRIGAGIASAATGGSFSQGYAQQRNREHEFENLNNMAQYAIKNARAEMKKFIKDHKDAISYDDEAEVNSIIEKIEEALNDKNAEHGDKNSKIKKCITALENKISSLRVRIEGGNTAQQGAQQGSQQSAGNNSQAAWGRSLNEFNEDELNVVRNKAIWGLQPGQIARRITERELDSVTGLNGFIIQEGCEAMIFVNGALVAQMEAGAYNVPQRSEQMLKQEFDKLYAEMEKQDKEKRAAADANKKPQTVAERGGLLGIAGGFLRRGWEFVFGATPAKKEKTNRDNEERVRRLKAEVEKALKVKNPEPVMSIILVSKRNISLSFGGVDNGNGIDYQPYTIPVGIFDVQMGVMLQLKVTNISAFATNYLADRNTCTSNDFFKMLVTTIENCLSQNLRNVDYQREGLAPAMVENLKIQITNIINQQLFGIECVQVLQITDRNADFERFRNVEKELYCTEKELDYLQRTGEFRNRLAIETNKQAIQQATNDEDLRYALQQINKDQMLHDDELEAFVLMLNAQKRIREAKSDEDERQAYIDLKKSGLVKDEELEVLKDALEQNKIQRESVTEILRIQNMHSVDDARLKAEWALDDMKQDHDWEREDLARRRNWGIEDEERERQWQVEDQELQRSLNQDMMRAQHENQMTDVELDTARKMDDYQFSKDERQHDADFNRAQRQRDADWEQTLREEQMRRENSETDYTRARQDKFDDAELARRSMEDKMRMMQAMEEADLKKQQEANRSAENLHSMDIQAQMNRDNVEATMSAEAIMAKQAAQLGGEGQVALAQALGSGKENELLQKQQAEQAALYQQMLQMQQAQGNQSQQQMMEMMKMMQQGMMGIAGANMANQQAMFNQQQQYQQQRYDDAVAMKNEYRENAMHQQDRMDANQQQALNYTTRAHQTDSQSFAQAMGGVPGGFQQQPQQQPQQPVQQPVQQQFQQPVQEPAQKAAPAGKFCPSCGAVNPMDGMFCEECGTKL